MRFAAVMVVCAGLGEARALAADVTRVFRFPDLDRASFQPAGQDAEQFLDFGPGGLRIKLRDGATHGPTGVALRFPVVGDFEIISRYEIADVEPPEIGYGVGLGIYIETDSPTKEGLTLERFVVPMEGEVFASTRSSVDASGAPRYSGKRFPAHARSGKLRLARRDSTVTVSVVEGNAPHYRVLQKIDIGTGDLAYVRLAGDTGGSASRLDACFQDLRITAKSFSRPEPRILSPSKTWLSLGARLGAAVIVVASMVYWSRRKVPLGW